MAGSIGVIMAVVSAVSSVVSLAMTLSMRQQGADDIGTSIDRKGTDNPKIIAFGNCRIPAVRVWNNVNNHNSEYLAQAYSLGIGELKTVEQIFIDGVPYHPAQIEPDIWYSLKTSREFPNAALGVRKGKAHEEAYTQLFRHSDGEWTEECRGDRTASISMLVHRQINDDGDNNVRIVSDRLEVEALVQGNAVIDPRTDPYLEGIMFLDRRTWNSYRNPACVILTYLVDNYYGMGIPASAIDVKSFVDLANHCEEKHIYFDGYVDQNQSFGDILKDMVTSFDGVIYVEDGRIVAKADKASAVVTDITESDCVGSFKLSNASESSYYNIVNVEYVNTHTTFLKDKYVLPADITPVHQRDGFEKIKDFKMPYTAEENGASFVKHVANKALKAVNYQRTVEFELDNTKKNLKVWDVFTISNSAYKLDKAMFRVDKVVTSLDDKTMVSKITATQYDYSVYDDSDYTDGNHSNPVLPPTNQILEPVDLEFVQTSSGTTGSGVLSWTPRYQREHKITIEYKLASAPTWTRVGEFGVTSYTFSNLPHDTYDFRVRAVAYSGAISPWATLKGVAITSDILMPKVTGLLGNFATQDCIIKWDDMTKLSMGGNKTYAEVFSHYEVIIYVGNEEAYRSTHLPTSNYFTYTFEQHKTEGTPNRKLYFEVKMVSKDGVKSQSAAELHIKNDQCAQPSGVHVSGILTTVYARWDQPEEVDYAGSEIHVSIDPIFEPTSESLIGVSKGEAFPIEMGKGNYYLRVGHFDVFGSDEMAYSEPLFFTQVSVDDVLEETPLWGDLENSLGDIRGDIEQAKDDILANATEIDKAAITIGSQGALISANAQAIQSTQGNLAEFEQEVVADFQGVTTSIRENQTAIADAERSIAAVETSLSSELDGVKANLGQNYYTKTQTDGKVSTAIAASESKLNAEIGKNKASINTLNQVTATTDGKVEALTQIKHDVNGKVSGLIMGNDGETSNFTVIADKFMVSEGAGEKAVFQVVNGKTTIKNALIGTLNAENINGGAITGNHIASNTKIIAGQGNTSAILDGMDATYRLYTGHATPASAPFRVDKTGKLYATNADIKGVIRATQLIFEEGVPSTLETPTGAQNKANAAKSQAISTAATDATNKANAAKAVGTAAQNGVNTINGKMYPNQSKIQIKSASYVAGSSGWAIDADGSAEFNQVTVRGDVYAKRGTLDNVTINSNCTVKGKIEANQIIGDVVSAISKNTPTLEITTKGTHVFGGVTVKNPRPYDRTLMCNLYMTVKATSGYQGSAHISAYVESTGSFGTARSAWLVAKVSGASQHETLREEHYCPVVLTFKVPANTKGSQTFKLVVPDATGSTGSIKATLGGQGGSEMWTTFLFKDGGDLA